MREIEFGEPITKVQAGEMKSKTFFGTPWSEGYRVGAVMIETKIDGRLAFEVRLISHTEIDSFLNEYQHATEYDYRPTMLTFREKVAQ